jgi:CRP/FNR family transcriptional regulator
MREEFAATFPVFRQHDSVLLEKILSDASYRAFTENDQIYMEGDRCTGIAFLLSGEIRVYKVSEGGREITLYQIFPGETCILNASCILSRQLYPANATGIADGTMLYLPQKAFLELMAEFEAMRGFIFSLFSQRFNEIIELIEAVTFGRMDFRLKDYLIEKSENDQLQTTHQKIANDLGTSREVVSRLLKDFERQGQINLGRNRIEIVHI